MLQVNFAPAFIIVFIANTVVAQPQQADFDLLCQGTRVTHDNGKVIERVPFSEVWTISQARSQVQDSLDTTFSAKIRANTIEWSKDFTPYNNMKGSVMKGSVNVKIDRRSQIYKGMYYSEIIENGVSYILMQNFNGKCSILGAPKF